MFGFGFDMELVLLAAACGISGLRAGRGVPVIIVFDCIYSYIVRIWDCALSMHVQLGFVVHINKELHMCVCICVCFGRPPKCVIRKYSKEEYGKDNIGLHMRKMNSLQCKIIKIVRFLFCNMYHTCNGVDGVVKLV